MENISCEVYGLSFIIATESHHLCWLDIRLDHIFYCDASLLTREKSCSSNCVCEKEGEKRHDILKTLS